MRLERVVNKNMVYCGTCYLPGTLHYCQMRSHRQAG